MMQQFFPELHNTVCGFKDLEAIFLNIQFLEINSVLPISSSGSKKMYTVKSS